MELTESMRQIDDSQFFDILNRIRIGSPNEDDIKILKSRLIETKNDLIEDTANFYNKLLEKSGIQFVYSHVEIKLIILMKK